MVSYAADTQDFTHSDTGMWSSTCQWPASQVRIEESKGVGWVEIAILKDLLTIYHSKAQAPLLGPPSPLPSSSPDPSLPYSLQPQWLFTVLSTWQDFSFAWNNLLPKIHVTPFLPFLSGLPTPDLSFPLLYFASLTVILSIKLLPCPSCLFWLNVSFWREDTCAKCPVTKTVHSKC